MDHIKIWKDKGPTMGLTKKGKFTKKKAIISAA